MGVKAASCRLSLESVESGEGCTESLHCSLLRGVVKVVGGGGTVLSTLLTEMEELTLLNISDKRSVAGDEGEILDLCRFRVGGGEEKRLRMGTKKFAPLGRELFKAIGLGLEENNVLKSVGGN